MEILHAIFSDFHGVQYRNVFFSNAKFLFGISTALFVLLDWGPPRVSTLASAKGISVAIFLDL